MTLQHEVQIEYVLQCINKMQRDSIKSLEVKQRPTTDFNNHTDAWHAKYSVWSESCRRYVSLKPTPQNRPNFRMLAGTRRIKRTVAYMSGVGLYSTT